MCMCVCMCMCMCMCMCSLLSSSSARAMFAVAFSVALSPGLTVRTCGARACFSECRRVVHPVKRTETSPSPLAFRRFPVCVALAMAKRKAVELTIHIKEARDLVAPSDAKGNPVPLNSSVSFTLLNLAKEQTEVVAESTTPAYGFSTTLKLPTDDASLAQLVAAPLLLSVEADGVVRGVVRLDLAPLLEQVGLEEAWLPLAPGPEGGEVAGELLVAVEAETPLLSEDDLEESAVLTLRLGAVHKLPERWLLAEGEEADGHIFAYKAGVSFQVGAGLPSIEIPAGLIQLAIQPPAPAVAEGEEAAAPAEAPADAPEGEGEGEGEAAAAEPAPPPTEAEVGNAEEQAAQSISFDGMALRTFLGPAAMLALREAAEAGVAPLTVTFAREVKNPDAHIDPNEAKYAGLVEVPFAAMMAVDQTEGLVRAAVAHAAPAEAAQDAEEAAADPKAKKEAPKKGAKGPEELPVEEEEEVHPQVDVATLALALTLALPLPPTLRLPLTCRPCCCCRCTPTRRAAPTCACS